MTTAPLSGHVFDGPPPGSGATPTDVDFVTSSDDIVAFWTGFSTPLAPVTSYSVRLGTCSGCDDVVADFDIGLSEGLFTQAWQRLIVWSNTIVLLKCRSIARSPRYYSSKDIFLCSVHERKIRRGLFDEQKPKDSKALLQEFLLQKKCFLYVKDWFNYLQLRECSKSCELQIYPEKERERERDIKRETERETVLAMTCLNFLLLYK